MDNKDKVFLSGLWRHTSKKGQTYYSGTLGGGRLLVFANNRKKTEESPDLMLYLAPVTTTEEALVTDPLEDLR